MPNIHLPQHWLRRYFKVESYPPTLIFEYFVILEIFLVRDSEIFI